MSKIKSAYLISIKSLIYTVIFSFFFGGGYASNYVDEDYAEDLYEEMRQIHRDIEHLKTLDCASVISATAIRLIRERGYDTSGQRRDISQVRLKEELLNRYGANYNGHFPIHMFSSFLLDNSHLTEAQAVAVVAGFEEEGWIFTLDDMNKKVVELGLDVVEESDDESDEELHVNRITNNGASGNAVPVPSPGKNTSALLLQNSKKTL